VSTEVHPDDIFCTFCGFAASEPLHEPKYGSHEFQGPVTEIAPVVGELYAFTANEGLLKPSEKRYYVIYWSPVLQMPGYYVHRGEIETEEDIKALSIAIAGSTGALLPTIINWKPIS
jgi:hypothetical protein